MANPTTKGNQGNSSHPTMEKAREMGSQVADKAREAGSQIADKAKEAASSVGQMASSAASTVGHKAEDLTSSAGAGIKHLGEALGQKAPRDGMLGDASQAVARGLQDSGRYIEEAGLSGMADDVTNLIRRNPVPAILVGLGIGFLLGRVMRS